MIIFSNSSICSMGRSALDNVHARGIQRNGLATVRIYIFEYRPMSTHTGTHHAPRSDSDLCLTHLHKYPDPQVRFPMVLPMAKPMKIHGLPRVTTCLSEYLPIDKYLTRESGSPFPWICHRSKYGHFLAKNSQVQIRVTRECTHEQP